MAAIVSNAVTGNWDAAASWVGGVIPGDGDTVTLANGAVITIPVGATVTVGDNLNVVYATAIPAIQVNSATGTGRLVVNGKLILKGHVKQGNATWVCGPGAVVNGGGTSGMNWSWGISLASSQANALLQINGTQAQPVTFGLESGADRMGTLGNAGSAFLDGGRVQATWCNWTGWAPNASTVAAYLGHANSAAFDTYFRNCTFDGCGILQISNITTGDIKFELSRCKIANPAASNGRAMFIGATSWVSTGITASGVRLIDSCVIYGQVVFSVAVTNPNDFTFTNNIFQPASATSTVSALAISTRCALWRNNLIYSNQNGNGGASVAKPPCGLLSDTLFLRKSNNASADIDMCRVTGYTADITIDGAVVEFQDCGSSGASPDTGGDFYIIEDQHATITVTHTIRNSIFLPNEDGGANGTSIVLVHASVADWSRTRMVMEHCTVVGKSGTEGLFKVGEGAVAITAPSALGVCRSNLVWTATGKAIKLTGKIISGGTGRIPDGALDGCDHNAFHGLTPATDPYSNLNPLEYANPAPPGTHDVVADPQFLDRTRDFGSWAVSVDPSLTTWALAVAAMEETVLQRGAYNPALTVPNALAWIRSGFRVQNELFRNAAHDGSAIGAVAFPVLVPRSSGGGAAAKSRKGYPMMSKPPRAGSGRGRF